MIFSLANSGSIAFSRVMGPGAIENIPLNPALFNSGRFSILPASTITGICSFCASFSILYGTFPIAVCRSAFPSPVIMRSDDHDHTNSQCRSYDRNQADEPILTKLVKSLFNI